MVKGPLDGEEWLAGTHALSAPGLYSQRSIRILEKGRLAFTQGKVSEGLPVRSSGYNPKMLY